MKMPVILLSFSQLCIFGVHLGHDYSKVFLLTSWMFYGWYSNMFMMSLYKTFLNFSYAIQIFYSSGAFNSPMWFVCMRSAFSPLVSCYAYVSGEVFSSYWWVNGSVTNFYSMLGWNQVMARLMMMNKHYLRFSDMKKMAKFYGLVNYSSSLPGIGFAPSVLNNLAAVEEFMAGSIPCAAIVDSNVPSTAITLPIPGNDDSVVCMNFYCYIFSSALMAGKVSVLYFWSRSLKSSSMYMNWLKKRSSIFTLSAKFRHTTQFVYLYTNFYSYTNTNDFFQLFDEIYNTEIIYNISMENAMNIWLANTKLVGKFRYYAGKIFTIVGESPPDNYSSFDMDLD